jgi:hypothetical protein
MEYVIACFASLIPLLSRHLAADRLLLVLLGGRAKQANLKVSECSKR